MTTTASTALGMTWQEAGLTVVTATAVYAAIIAASRVFGQRQFATASAYDLAFTFALGSIIGRVILVRTSLANALVGLLTMFVLHSATGWLHHHVRWFHELVQNRPILLVAHGEVLDENLRRANTSFIEVCQYLRRAGYGSLEQVGALVLERTGQVSIIPAGEALDSRVFTEVEDTDRLLRPES